MKRTLLLLIAICTDIAAKAQNKSIPVPQIFQEGVISRGDYESHPAFSPTGDTLYFIKCSFDLKLSAIYVSYKHSGQWSEPQVAPFSGKYMDADPFVTRDGKALFFMSNRPLKDGDAPRDYTDIWKVNITKNGLSEPV